MAKRKRDTRNEGDEAAQTGIDQRVQRSKQVVLDATFRLMSEAGIGGVSIDEISRTTGVAKTTIYRHWPSRSALLMDACSRLRTRVEAPDTGSFKKDLVALTTRLSGQLQSARWPSILPSIIDAAERDPELAKLHSELQAEFTAPYLAVFERARSRGELARGIESAELVACIFGPFFYRRWFSREPIDARFVKRIVERAIGAEKPRRK
jgi:AcrR family transcriptional regulator